MKYSELRAHRALHPVKVFTGTVRPATLDRETEVILERRDRKRLVERELMPSKGKPRKLFDPID